MLLKSCTRSIFWNLNFFWRFGICPRWLHITLLLFIKWIWVFYCHLESLKYIERPKRKCITNYMDFRINGQRLHLYSKVRCLGVILQKYFEWELHLSIWTKRLNRAVGILANIQHYISKFLLKAIYFSLFFKSHLIYNEG